MRRRSQYTVHLQPKLVSNHNHTSKAISKTFSKLMKDIGLIDIWRAMFPNASNAHITLPPTTRIDYFIIFGRDRSRIRDSDIGTIDLSDHAPIYILLSIWRTTKEIQHGDLIQAFLMTSHLKRK